MSNLNTKNLTCTNCGDTPTGKIVRNLCPACRIFETRNGRPRTGADMIRRKGMHPPLCVRCRNDFACGHRELCSACRQYLRLHGKPRPRHLFYEACKVCGRPRVPGFSKGRCQICANYRNKNGRDRTPAMVAKCLPFGWCECGQKAIGEFILRHGEYYAEVSRRNETETTYALCGECASAEGIAGPGPGPGPVPARAAR